jgi:hypothetical protein
MNKKAAKSLSKTPAKGGIAGKSRGTRARVRFRLSLEEIERIQEMKKRSGLKEPDLLRFALMAGLPKLEKSLEAGEPKNIIPFPLS